MNDKKIFVGSNPPSFVDRFGVPVLLMAVVALGGFIYAGTQMFSRAKPPQPTYTLPLPVAPSYKPREPIEEVAVEPPKPPVNLFPARQEPIQQVSAPIPARSTEERSARADEFTVYVTNTGTRYHCEGCSYLRQSKIAMEFGKARRNYVPCLICKPPLDYPKAEKKPEPVVATPAYSPPPTSSNPGTTPTGLQLHVGPRGGVYHYSASGKKVYQKKK